MVNKTKKNRTNLKIFGATVTAIFSLISVFTGTYAWFASNGSATATGMQVKVKAPETVEFEMYYLSSFADANENTHDGNYNSVTHFYSGYETAYQTASFTQIDFENLPEAPDPSPVGIDHLWPAHKLTFAIVITSGSVNKFSLTDWNEGEGHETNLTPKINSTQYVRLSWAIDIYGAAYSVAKTNSTLNDIAGAYSSSYYGASLNDVFTYSETNLAPLEKEEIEIVNPLPNSAGQYQTIVFFTVEFSNSNTTFYSYNKTTGYYEKSTTGNSNCYEKLALNSLKFEIR